MKSKKKHVGTKAKIRAEKERERKIATALFTTIILITIILSVCFGYQILSSPFIGEALPEPTRQFKPANPNSALKVAIVDHLSLTAPNETFVQKAATILVNANYIVDYFSGEKVTVEFYRSLPAHGYKIIILRVHSAGFETEGQSTLLSIFTSEPYSNTKYVQEQLTDQLGCNSYTRPGEPPFYFGILPKFVTSSMKGNFQNALIIMMGCEGLKQTMAEAFIQKGAKAYIGWNASVSASHTDAATTILLQHLITEKQTIKKAVEKTMKEVGPDPTHNSVLAYYPLTTADQTINKPSKNLFTTF